MRRRCLLPAPLLALLNLAGAQQLPYNPTRIFLSPQNDRLAYVLQPQSATGWQFSISTLDLGGKTDPTKPSLTPISSGLPFLSNSSQTPFNAVISENGNITVFTGDCGSTGEIWKLDTQGREKDLPAWKQQAKGGAGAPASGPMYLSSAVAFTSNASAPARNPKYFYFGGMCSSSGSTAASWQSNAAYSNNMVVLSSASGVYSTNLATTRNLPIAQAGQSLVPLPPTFSNHSDGSVTQQRDFVLLGGHTQTAFINMSQVALWSLPQQAWTYFPVATGSSGARTDLAVRDSVEVQPRSGHTAVLSSDGTKIVLFGGWVGDISTPAQPQLAVMNVADSYGGSGDWSWNVPAVSDQNGPTAGSGLYGHGAVMLPGNVMLIMGGYNVNPTSSQMRRAAAVLNNRAFLFNVTSGKWLASYTKPPKSADAAGDSSPGPLSQTSQKAGLGIGLGLGAIAFLALFGAYLWYVRRNKQLQEEREKEILEISAHRSDSSLFMSSATAGPYSRVPDLDWHGDRYQAERQSYPEQPNWRSTGNEAERTGLLVELPSPTRGLRKSLIGGRSRPSHEYRQSQNMDAIEEYGDLELSRKGSIDGVDIPMRRTGSRPTSSVHVLDPFVDAANPLRSHPTSMEITPGKGKTRQERENEVRSWHENWEIAAGALMNRRDAPRQDGSGGGSSPTKSDRTETMMTDSSTTSSWSRSSGAPGGIARALSTRSAALLNSLTTSLMGTQPSPILERAESTDARSELPSQKRRYASAGSTTAGAAPPPIRSRPESAHREASLSSPNTDSFSTAVTSDVQYRAEREALLGGEGGQPGPITTRARGKSEPSSPVKERRAGWLGSVRRVISGARTASMTAAQSRPGDRAGSASPTKTGFGEEVKVPPRRTVSDAAFMRSRRGARDWNAHDEEEQEQLQRPSALDEEDHDDEWDVERAAENRVVQLMFTVPRQRLRIVNLAETDRNSLMSRGESVTERDAAQDW